MKFIIATFFVFSSAMMSCEQDIDQSNVPAVVLKTFQSTFPDAQHIEWEKSGDIYEAEFDLQHVDYNAFIDASGNLILYKYDISINEIPQAVTNTIQADFAGYRIDDVDLVDKDGEKFYEIELENNTVDQVVVFSEDGVVTENVNTFEDK